MTPPSARSPVERRSRRLSQVALWLIVGFLVIGLALSLTSARHVSVIFLGAACLLLAALPALAVVTVFVDRIHQRDWPFAFAAALVIGLLLFNVAIRI